MDDTSELVKNFENILKKTSHKNPVSLYSGVNVRGPEKAYSCQEVLTTVSRQLKAIQNADCVTNKSVPKNLIKFKSSTFLPVNMLPRSIEVPSKPENASTFETQCVSDTQLIHIIQDVEALDTHNGITQEFDMPFCHMNAENEGSTHQEPMFPIIDISLKEPDPNKSYHILSPDKDVNIAVKIETQPEDSQLIKECIEIENVEQPGNFIEDTNVPIDTSPSSPILNIRRIKKPNTKSIVVDLDVFEKFEKIAAPLVEETEDLNSAKELINSQIIDKELCLQSNLEPILNEIHTFDFIQELTNEKSTIQGVTSDKNENTEQVDTKSKENSQVSDKFILKDEILFSSDEEEEYMHKSVQDLPFTCALETSFYEQSDILDKTMFVGFQTASNKSIQICSETFSKAKSMLEDVSEETSKEPTLTEMVNICDSFNTKQVSNIIDDNFVSKTEEIKDRVTENIVCDFIEFEINGKADSKALFHDEDQFQPTSGINSDTKNEVFSQKRKFDGFKTASNKRIKLSDNALEKSKKIFQDIDLNTSSFETNDTKFRVNTNNDGPIDIKSDIADIMASLASEKPEAESSEVVQHIKIDDVTILKEFENEEMNTQFSDQTKNSENVQLLGFKTASNKNIEISKVAMEKTNKIFQDIDFGNKIDENINKSKEVALIESAVQSNMGFRTASNKQINVSEKALATMKDIFRDIETIDVKNTDTTTDKVEDENIRKKNTMKGLLGFRTASNNEIDISEEAFSKSKNIFRDVERGNSFQVIKEKDHKGIKHEGFKTASNKKVSISAKAMARTKKIFENLDEDVTKNLLIVEDPVEPPFYGFGYPKSKEVDMIEEELSRDKTIFEEFELNDDFDKNKDSVIESHNPVFQGFQTASEKPLKISTKALARSRNLFKDIDLIEEKYDKNARKNEHSGSNKPAKSDKALINIRNVFQDMDTEIMTMSEKEDNVFKFQGFQTASKKPVKVSDDALAKSRKIFQDIDKDVPVEINTKSKLGFQTVIDKPIVTTEEVISKGRKPITDENTKISSKFQGFQTANNKPVSISEEALAKSRNIFQDIESSRPELQSNIEPEKNPPTKFVGFQTASNKAVKISESALAKSRKLFQDLDEVAPNIETKNQALISKFEGFQTASNKHVNISEESLVKSKQLFQDIGISDGRIIKNYEDNNSSSKFVGFQTASNKKVKVSEEALNKCRKIFQDLNGDDKEDLVNEAASFKCFQTASNKPVAVSEQALLKSRKIFQDIDLSDDNGKNKHQAANKNVSLSKRENIPKNEDDKLILSQIIEFKPATNNNAKISEQSPKPEKVSNELSNNQNQTELESKKLSVNERDKAKNVTTYEFNLQNIINTQVMTNFEETLYTEDFLKETTPKSNKRSGSPILSCPKAKKRKRFEIPYSQKPVEEKRVATEETLVKSVQNHATPVNFDKNYKKIKKYSLKDLERMENESNNEDKEIDPYILGFNFENLLKFEFFGKRNDITDKKFNIEDLKRVFLEYVNRKLVPDGWTDNHLKLILWKLISYEIKYPKTMKYTCSAKNVIEQLKYRYRRELYDAERPALRKILEKDDTSMRTIILCVVAIFEDGVSVSSATNPSNIELLLTDGWYCIKACVDRMLATLVCAGKIVVGTKLATHGAELVNCEQGVSPWEDTTSIRLKLSGNSTRRARWHARLGYHGNAAILSQLSNVRSDGGRVAKLRAYVARVYPALYVEKFASGSTVTRSERLEHLHQARYEAERQSLLEKLYEDVEKEFSLQSQCSQRQQESPRQRERLLQDIQARVQEKMQSQGLEVTRNVVPLLKMRVVGVAEKRGVVEVNKAMIAIWKPNEAVLEIIKEGSWMEVMNVVPTAVRYSELQLSAGRQSVFSQSKFKETEKIKPYLKALKRTCYTIKNLAKNPSMSTEYNEIDTVGFIFLIEPSREFDPKMHPFQNVYLADAEKNMICINFWGGLKKFGFENVLDTGQFVSCTNLQKRAGNTRKNIPQYRVTEFSYFTKTPKSFEARKSIDDLSRLFNGIDINKFCEECLNLKNNYVAKMQGRYENISPYRLPNIDINSSKNKMFIDSPLAQKPIKMDDLNLTGLDFESTFKQTDTQDLSPKTLLRKMQVKEKLAKLKMYGEPPALSPIHILNKSKNAGSAFKSPLISKSDDSPNVASEQRNLLKQKEEEIQCSPVFSMNRTYVKKNSNPVKLNFSNSAMDETNASEIDHFAEEFDGSPPLSLD